MKCVEFDMKIHDLIIDCESYVEGCHDSDLEFEKTFKTNVEDAQYQQLRQESQNRLIKDSDNIRKLILEI